MALTIITTTRTAAMAIMGIATKRIPAMLIMATLTATAAI